MLETYGNPNCSLCGGVGRLPVTPPEGYRGPPSVRLCRCVLLREFAERMDRGWRGISRAEKVPSSPLLPLVEQDVWITAHEPWLKSHVRHVAYRQSLRWEFRVVNDASLLTAWLATAAVAGAKIYDADMSRSIEEGERRNRPSFEYLTLKDIAVPSDLLIIKLGVKTTPNKEMANTFLETILERQHAGKPTWVWDQPEHPLEEDNHRCHSFEVLNELSTWERVRETHEGQRVVPSTRSSVTFFPGVGDSAPDVSTSLEVVDVTPPPEEEAASAEPEVAEVVEEGSALASYMARLDDGNDDGGKPKKYKKPKKNRGGFNS